MDGSAGLKPLVILGATGSIGRQTLAVAAALDLEVSGLAANRADGPFAGLARDHSEARLAIAGGTRAERRDLASEFGPRIDFGTAAVASVAAIPASIVVNGIVGSAGLGPSVAALEAGNRLALANKESMVAGGPVMRAAADRSGAEIIPVDSEHSALWQALAGESRGAIRRLILTASGGPFRGRKAEDVAAVSVAEALAHPTWDMGPRISIDSATLMNKAFEVIEAHYLFDVGYDAIAVVVHPQSVVHSMVEYVDGSVKAQLGDPDMRVPIQYAITYPERAPAPIGPLDLVGSSLTFEEPDVAAFPCLSLGYEAGRRAGSAPAVLNAADEEAVAAFLDERIAFGDIPRVVADALETVPHTEVGSVDDVLAVDAEARRVVADLVSRIPA